MESGKVKDTKLFAMLWYRSESKSNDLNRSTRTCVNCNWPGIRQKYLKQRKKNTLCVEQASRWLNAAVNRINKCENGQFKINNRQTHSKANTVELNWKIVFWHIAAPIRLWCTDMISFFSCVDTAAAAATITANVFDYLAGWLCVAFN